jgi:hypothetical protein
MERRRSLNVVRRGDALTNIGLRGLKVFLEVTIYFVLFAVWHHVVIREGLIPQGYQLGALVPLGSLR